jgi:hypothetical protein
LAALLWLLEPGSIAASSSGSPGGMGQAVRGDGDAVEIDRPLPAATIEMARSGSAQDEPCAAQEAASEQEPGTGQGDVAAAAQLLPSARRRRRARTARTSR